MLWLRRIGEWVLVIALALVLATVSMALICAVAHADTDNDADFLESLRGIVTNPNGVDALINSGHTICHSLEAGVSESDVKQRVWLTSRLDYSDASYLVDMSEEYYCPSYY